MNQSIESQKQLTKILQKMQIRDLKQDQCKRSVKTSSNELYKHDQCCR